MLDIFYTSKFKKDYKKMVKQGKPLQELEKIITLLQKQEALPEKHKDHQLTGNYAGFRECHITPDWLLIYQVKEEQLILALARTGSHSELF
ncbi:type II toxin-antitoxin system YafQ family toxin [Enterococcus sp. BWB1-3]|uniref:type II toxin-antitoxin system YafQ family toxin n=1 Tax=unclassified Enterococcus TaxID=2608891 RepID=UPI001922C3D8|nr:MULTISPECIES: type II toxin-antitoxin system YafQ family toxin [unclassified Enterococcus]MBL1230982.1 type II toxin-antitoxin system YafQ family toxin [Enterococcus sp. BWB1-3]MCB5950883.1 type II toxin-antitoxin system YafQ family toxin [Enterococcus sp. BWT-B8]MCB5955519.1 type II toxin-antitoxin system YafQ family toxin [Enterococcus sp. CWB-B31]